MHGMDFKIGKVQHRRSGKINFFPNRSAHIGLGKNTDALDIRCDGGFFHALCDEFVTLRFGHSRLRLNQNMLDVKLVHRHCGIV